MSVNDPAPLVFFTGGTALRELSRELTCRPCRTVHLVTTFDSGGSTARLRSAFAMPAVGDLRNRLVALADVRACGQAIIDCLNTRLPEEGDAQELRLSLMAMADPTHNVWLGIDARTAHTLQDCLSAFLHAMPRNFDARQASLGNVCMAGRYLQEHRSLRTALPLFRRLLHARGYVLPIVEESLHLAAHLQDGSTLVGQHHFKNLASPVRSLFLTVREPERCHTNPEVCRPRALSQALAALRAASLICYPMGSFYSSVVANLLADGVGQCVSANACPRVFIPNTGPDRELLGLDITGQLRVLVSTLQADNPAALPRDFVSHIIIDRRHGRYQGNVDELETCARHLGIRVWDVPVVQKNGQGHDAAATADVLLELAGPAALSDACEPEKTRLQHDKGDPGGEA